MDQWSKLYFLVWMPSLKFKPWIESSVRFFLTGNGKIKSWVGEEVHWLLQRVHTNHHQMISIDCQFFQLFSPKKYQRIKSQFSGYQKLSHKPKTFAFFLSNNRTKVRQTANKCNRKSFWKSFFLFLNILFCFRTT